PLHRHDALPIAHAAARRRPVADDGPRDRRVRGQKPAVILVNARSSCAIPLQLEVTPPPSQPRSRLTAQYANRVRPFSFAQSRICSHCSGVVISPTSDTPFIPEIPVWAHASASDQPCAAFSWSLRPCAALIVSATMSDPPKSNVMTV